MSNLGWIKIYRQLQECSLWDTGKPFDERSAWIDLLLLANHRDKEIVFDGHPIIIGRGQYLTSVRKLSERWAWSNQKTLRYLRLLESLKMITKNSDSRRTLLTIVNYEVYQDTDSESGTVPLTVAEQSRNSNGTVTERQSTTNKNIKNDKNDKNVKNEKKYIGQNYFPNDEALNNEFIEYIKMRKSIKKPMTDRAIDLAIRDLNKFSEGNNDKAILIIQQSIKNCWQGLFPLKDNTQNKQRDLFDELHNCV